MSGALLAFVAVNFIAAMSGGIFKPGAWYETLNKPGWRPPKWAFPVVWSILYLLNALAGWWVWLEVGFEGPGVPAMIIYGVSLVLNAAWSAIFFGMKRMRLALLEAIALWISILLQIIAFWPISANAALILLPYLAWVSVAILLNRSMLKLNPQFA